jgi:hypothetical protein
MDTMFLGGGVLLYRCGIPSISLVPDPDYLCQILPDGGLERLSADFAYPQVQRFSHALSYLDTIPAEDVGEVTPPWDRPLNLLKSKMTMNQRRI